MKAKGPNKKYPETYYRRLWISKDLYTGLQLIARVEGASIKKIAEWFIEYGLARYDYRECEEQEARNEEAENRGTLAQRSAYMQEMDKLARANGVDWIRKIQGKYAGLPRNRRTD